MLVTAGIAVWIAMRRLYDVAVEVIDLKGISNVVSPLLAAVRVYIIYCFLVFDSKDFRLTCPYVVDAVAIKKTKITVCFIIKPYATVCRERLTAVEASTHQVGKRLRPTACR